MTLIGPHYVARCPCGAVLRVPADVGLLTAECTLRYAGWRRTTKAWRCGKCQ